MTATEHLIHPMHIAYDREISSQQLSVPVKRIVVFVPWDAPGDKDKLHGEPSQRG
jgi:hypothetical protein